MCVCVWKLQYITLDCSALKKTFCIRLNNNSTVLFAILGTLSLSRPIYMPFRYFSPYEYLVISLPLTPHVPIPTRPFTLSGDAKMLSCARPAFFVLFDVKFNHLFLSCSRSSSSTLNRCCFFAFFFFKYSLLLGRCRLQ